MLTLALDTTTRAGSVAVLRDTTILASLAGDATRTHGERLPAELERALSEAKVSARDLDLLVVASGPGAFTGLRIGLATIQGLAMVLNLPVIAISALDALALFAAGERVRRSGDRSSSGESLIVSAWMDAQRGEVFAAHYDLTRNSRDVPVPVAAPMVAKPDHVLSTLPFGGHVMFTGDGAIHYTAEILQTYGARPQEIAVIAPPSQLAPFLAAIGLRRAARGEAGPPHAVQPLYVRRADAELERQRRASASASAPAASTRVKQTD